MRFEDGRVEVARLGAGNAGIEIDPERTIGLLPPDLPTSFTLGQLDCRFG